MEMSNAEQRWVLAGLLVALALATALLLGWRPGAWEVPLSAPVPTIITYTCGPEYNGRCWKSVGGPHPEWAQPESDRMRWEGRSGNWVSYTLTRGQTTYRFREWAP